MPTYDYRCPECDAVTEIVHSIKENPHYECPDCRDKGKSSILVRLISRNVGGFIFKQWTESKLYKVSRDKHRSNQDLEVKQIERYGTGPRLQPNIGGEEYGSWSEAKKAAKDKGLNANSYDALASSEKSISKVSGVDDKKWKAVKEKAN